MDVMNLIESLFRWMHVVAGILWIGLLYFFNWVNSAFAPTMDAETKKKVVPELMPRTLYWFRWGAAWTWFTGLILWGMVYVMNDQVLIFGMAGPTAVGVVLMAVAFLAVFLYDVIFKAVKAGVAQFFLGWILASVMVLLFAYVGKFEFRAYAIHLGAMFGTMMAFNVWFRIWPAQQKVIRAIKNGEAPDPSWAALAGMRSKHNTYMSVPLVFAMVSQHSVGWAPQSPFLLCGVIIFGWWVTGMLYRHAKKVPGF